MPDLVAKAAGELALQGSGWAVAVILGAWSFYLFKLLRDADKNHVEMLKQVIALAEGSRAGLAAAAKAADDTGRLVGTLTQGVQALSHEVEGDERETRHGVAGIVTGLNGIAERLNRLTERVDRVSDEVRTRERP